MKFDYKLLEGVVTKATGSPSIARYARAAIKAAVNLRLELIRETTSKKMKQHQANGRRMSRYLPYGW